MTIKELYKEIKTATMEVNKRLVEYYESDKRKKIVDKEIAILKDISGTSEKSSYLAMRLHHKNKNQLIAQLNYLKNFQQWDIYTPMAKREREAKTRARYESFNSNSTVKMSYIEYKRVTNIVGSLASNIIDSFGSNNINEMLDYVYRKKLSFSDAIKAMEQVMREYNDEGKYSEDYVDRWYEIMNEWNN